MKRREWLAVILALPFWAAGAGAAIGRPARFERGLLWSIRRPGVAPNWLFGTLHRPDPRLLPLAPPVAAAFGRCRRYMMELFPSAATAGRFAEAVEAEDKLGIAALLPPEVARRIVARLQEHGVPEQRAGRLKPWAALLLLTSDREASSVASIDAELFARAMAERMPIEALDSVEEQIAVFDSIPLDAQLALLIAAHEHGDALATIAEQGLAAYRDRDLVRLDAAGRALALWQPGIEAHQAILERKLIVDRSVVMAYRMQAFLRRGASFTAVGASHLAGASGIPALLEREYGWRVARVW